MTTSYFRLGLIAAAPLLVACASNASTVAQADADAGGPAPAPGACTPIAAERTTVRVKSELGTLEGTLDVPEGCGSVPVVLILSGSGSTDRDGNAPGATANPAIYRVLAEALHDAGLATLRYDDEGIGQSVTAAPDKVEDFRFGMEVDDAARFIAKLRDDARLGPLVVAGHSQGSLTAIMAAKAQPIDGFISLAGTGRPAGKLLHEQVAPRLTSAELDALDAAIASMERGVAPGALPAPLDKILPAPEQPYLISWMRVDPKVEIAALSAPTLLIQGKLDTQVQVLDANLLHDAKPDATLVLVDDMGHMLRRVTSKSSAAQNASYAQPLPLHPAVGDAVARFVKTLVHRTTAE